MISLRPLQTQVSQTLFFIDKQAIIAFYYSIELNCTSLGQAQCEGMDGGKRQMYRKSSLARPSVWTRKMPFIMYLTP